MNAETIARELEAAAKQANADKAAGCCVVCHDPINDDNPRSKAFEHIHKYCAIDPKVDCWVCEKTGEFCTACGGSGLKADWPSI